MPVLRLSPIFTWNIDLYTYVNWNVSRCDHYHCQRESKTGKQISNKFIQRQTTDVRSKIVYQKNDSSVKDSENLHHLIFQIKEKKTVLQRKRWNIFNLKGRKLHKIVNRWSIQFSVTVCIQKCIYVPGLDSKFLKFYPLLALFNFV